MRRAFLLTAALIAAAPSATAAKDIEFVKSSAIADKPTVTLDPARGHVLLRSPAQTSLYLMKVPNEQDRAAYAGLRAKALADTRKGYARKLAKYERDRKEARVRGFRQPERPVEPTEANFAFTPFDLLATVPIGPVNRFAKGEGGVSTYLHAVTPGRYRVYGPITPGPNGAVVGAFYCMGSVAFDVPAGQVVDISALVGAGPPVMASSSAAAPDIKISPGAAPVDRRIPAASVRPARFRPVGKLPNYFGIAVTRLPAMEGVLRYDRDRIVDLTGG